MHDSFSDLSDEELLKRFYADHDNRWLGILLPRYSLLLFGVCMKYLKNEEDARDCVQQVYLKVIDQLHRHDVAHFKSWLYMVTKNHCLMRLRDQKRYFVELNESLHPADDAHDRRMQRQQREQLLNRLHDNLEKLKPEQRICLEYFYLQKKSYAEIAALTGFSLLQVKSYLQNGRRKLEILMQEANQ